MNQDPVSLCTPDPCRPALGHPKRGRPQRGQLSEGKGVTEEQLEEQAKTLEGATKPDESTHDCPQKDPVCSCFFSRLTQKFIGNSSPHVSMEAQGRE
jgi:hypothetical protein